MARIALITPTGARPTQIALCANWMRNQAYDGEVVWIVVDDALPHSTDFIEIDFRPNWQIRKVYPLPVWEVGQNTQARNISAGLNALFGMYRKDEITAIFIIEDDDYYSPRYLQRMVGYSAVADLWGELCTVYYNVATRHWLRNMNRFHSSLFQTAFTPAAIPWLEQCWSEKYIDCRFFAITPRKHLFMDGDLSVGIKGQAGRSGIGMGHQHLMSYKHDPLGVALYDLIGDDVKHYIHDWDNSIVPNARAAGYGIQ